MELIRDCTNKMGTFGILTLWDLKFYTIEKPWLNNEPWISCIPVGIYTLEMSYFDRGEYPAYEVMNVPGRTDILIHIANIQSNVQGCIGLGEQLGCINGQWAVLSSKRALRTFHTALEDTDDRTLNISWKGV